MADFEFEGALTFFYYNNLEEAADFYKNILKFKLVMEKDWVKIFRIKENAHLGLVSGERGSHKPASTKPVRFQLMVRDALAWHTYLKEKGIHVDRERLYVGKELKIKAFTVSDPEGYVIEVCQYITPYGV